MLTQEKPQQIGVVAKTSGVPIKTIRYYEELGLLQSMGRTEGGYRLFNRDILSRLAFIKQSQSLGLSLAEIKEFLDIHDHGKLPCDQIKVKLQEKVTEIDQRIQQLQVLKSELNELLAVTSSSKESDTIICPIIQ